MIIAPRARFTAGTLTHVAMPPLAGPWRALLGDVVRALRLEAQVDPVLYAPSDARVVVHVATMRVWIDGALCEKLTDYHVRLLEMFARSPTHLLHSKDIADYVAQGNVRADTTRKVIEAFVVCATKSFIAMKKKPPKDLASLIEMPQRALYRLSVPSFLV